MQFLNFFFWLSHLHKSWKMVYFSFEFEPLNLSITDLLRLSLLFFITDKNLNDNEF